MWKEKLDLKKGQLKTAVVEESKWTFKKKKQIRKHKDELKKRKTLKETLKRWNLLERKEEEEWKRVNL